MPRTRTFKPVTSLPITAATIAARLRDAEAYIRAGFDWADSPEGEAFWDRVSTALLTRAERLERPPLTEADFLTKTPLGYDTIAHYLFINGGAERALSEEASKAGRALVGKLRREGDPLVRVRAPKAIVEATQSRVTEVFAYPLSVLDGFFYPPQAPAKSLGEALAEALKNRPVVEAPVPPPFSRFNPPRVGQAAVLVKGQAARFEEGDPVTVESRSGDGWNVSNSRGEIAWVFASSIRPV